jgi:hypothetical protein
VGTKYIWLWVASACSYSPPLSAVSDAPGVDPDVSTLTDAPADAPPDVPGDGRSDCPSTTITASKTYDDPSVFMNGSHSLGNDAVDIELPVNLPVSTGNAGNHCAELSFTAEDNSLVRCRYGGGANVAHVGSNVAEALLGLNYVFDECRLGAACPSPNGTVVVVVPGEPVAAKNDIVLSISNGDDEQGTTTASATIRICDG